MYYTLKNKNVVPSPLSPISQDWIWASLSLSLSSLQIGLIGDGFSLSLALFSISSKLLTLQENKSTATKPFCHTKVSISSLDVPGDEMVH